MKLVWCPDIATKAYIDTVKSCEVFEESSVAELVSAMAGGWNPHLIVETWCQGGAITTSVGLAVASQHTCGRHVCIVPDEATKSLYLAAMHGACGISPETIVGRVEDVMSGLSGIDFLVVDCRRNDFARVLKLAKLGHLGAVLICKNCSVASDSSFRWRSVVDSGSRIVRSCYLPVGYGLQIAYVAGGGSSVSPKASRWVKHVDESGEEHIYRR